MRPITQSVLGIVQNALRILAILAIPALYFLLAIMPSINLPLPTAQTPIWAQLITGAFLGGLIFTPAGKIGDLYWSIVTVYVRRQLGTPEPGEKPYSPKSLQFASWEKEMRRANLLTVSRKAVPASFKAAWVLWLPFIGLPIALAIIATVITLATGDTSLCNAAIVASILLLVAVIAYTVLAVLLLVTIVGGLKLYLH